MPVLGAGLTHPLFPGAPFDRVLVVDMETAYCTKTYTLSKMTTEEYIRDPRFHAWGFSWKELGGSAPAVWVTHEDIPAWCEEIDWSRTALLAHNAMFDVAIFCWIYGIRPAFIFDSLSMSRSLRGVEGGNSLAALAEEFGLPAKGKALHNTNGLFDYLPPQVEEELAEYCCHDTWLCEQVFLKLLHKDGWTFPIKELRLIDLILSMYVYPVLELDAPMLEEAIEEEATARTALLARLKIDEADLASNPKFARMLEALGVPAPMKVSKVTGKPALALAKSDALFQVLLNHDREEVALLCEARLKVKSTQARTRAQRFHAISQRGALPVPLAYYGAHTGRVQAMRGQVINMQNMKRGSFLRNAIMAPYGYVAVVGDLAQIEPRVLAWLADYEDMLEIFRSGADPYAAFGAEMFGIPGMTKETHEVLRQSAKSALLGAGFGLGWASFAAQLLTGFLGAPPKRYTKDEAKELGVTVEHVAKFLSWDVNIEKLQAIPHTCTEEELVIHCLAAKAIIDKYRAAAYVVVDLWAFMQHLLESSLYGGEVREYKGCIFRKEEIVMPNGMSLRYPGLRIKNRDERGRPVWVYGPENRPTRLHGPKIVENLTQGLARIIMTDGMLRVAKRYFVALTVHDEQVAVVPEAEGEEAKAWVEAQMVVNPKWMPGVPLAAGVGYHKRYGLAKK